MLHSLQALFVPAVLDRVVLLVNHVLRQDGAAPVRLQAYAGRTVRAQVEAWPAFLPPWPALALRITPAGLFERVCDGSGQGLAEPLDPADLRLWLDGSQPLALARGLAEGEAHGMRLEGDARLAADLQACLTQVRWDVAADLERAVGPGAAHALISLAAALISAATPRGGRR